MPIKSKDHFNGCVPVLLAINCGHVETLRILARLGANLNIVVGKDSPITHAMRHESKAVELVETLIGMGVDVSFIKNDVERYGDNVLLLRNVRKQFVKTLSEIFRDPDAVKKKYISEHNVYPIYFDIMKAIDVGDVAALVGYVKDSSISKTDKYKTNLFVEIALREASTKNLVIQIALINAGYDILRVNDGEDSVYKQITKNKIKLNGFALCLLGANADISDEIKAIGNDGMNDIHRAIIDGKTDFLCIVLSLGGDANISMQDGTLPISLVMKAKFNIQRMFYVLVKTGAKIDDFDIKNIQNLVDQHVINPDSVKYLKAAQSGEIQFPEMYKIMQQLEKSFWQKIILLDQSQIISSVKEFKSHKEIDIDKIVSGSSVFKKTLSVFSELDIVGIYTKFKAVDSDHQEIVLVGDTDE